MNQDAPVPVAAGTLPGASAPGVFIHAGPQLGRPAPQRMPFERPGTVPGLDGCTGVAGRGLCIRCDRLYQPGHQIAPEVRRGDGGVYVCPNQVVGGVHVCSVNSVTQGGKPLEPTEMKQAATRSNAHESR